MYRLTRDDQLTLVNKYLAAVETVKGDTHLRRKIEAWKAYVEEEEEDTEMLTHQLSELATKLRLLCRLLNE